jgi:hypothetical protein
MVKSKQLSNPASTGGGGGHFEAHIQANFVTLMLSGGYAPCLPCWPIVEIKLQGRIDGYETDDLIVFVQKDDTKERRKLLCQVKLSLAMTKGNPTFAEVIQAAWNDFNNVKVFTKNKDIIALITGPLNSTDGKSVRWLLDQARHTKNSAEFFKNVGQAKFSSKTNRDKLSAIQHHLKAANAGVDVAEGDVFSFLKHFHLLGYDLGKDVGVIASLLHSHISQYNRQHPDYIWTAIVDFVQSVNQNAGTITWDNLPEKLKEEFHQPIVRQIPEYLTNDVEVIADEQPEINWQVHELTSVLLSASLIGGWNESEELDRASISEVSGISYDEWVKGAREILHTNDSPLSLKENQWKVVDRVIYWHMLGTYVFDADLDVLKRTIVSVLSEKDPAFELSTEERYAARVHGKVLRHSSLKRKSLAETIALIGSQPEVLINCSHGKAETVAVLTIREILVNADWVLWGSLNDMLPDLAEAAPNEFLTAVENTLAMNPCPFDELFEQEGTGVFSTNYMVGLLWALETLAWGEELHVRTCVALAELASHDPGGKWANRPMNSLAEIMLPWLPQTIATVEKRQVALKTICREQPLVGWKLLINLLPNQHRTSTPNRKPKWRNIIPDDWDKGVTRDEYWQQSSFCAEQAVSLVGFDIDKISQLVDQFDHLPATASAQLIEIISSKKITKLGEKECLALWNRISKFIAKHRRFTDAKWALSKDQLAPLVSVNDLIAPSNPFFLHNRLFSERSGDLYERKGDWLEQEGKINEDRRRAISELLDIGGVELVIEFSYTIENPRLVGRALGEVSNAVIDSFLLPEKIIENDSVLWNLCSHYAWSRRHALGWKWFDDIDKSNWSSEQISALLRCLPFTGEAWQRVEKNLQEKQNEFWLKTEGNAYQTDEGDDLEYVIEKLLAYDRPYSAIQCFSKIFYDKKPINFSLCCKTLLAAVSTKEPMHQIDDYIIGELIKVLQENTEEDQEALFQVEWAYMSILDEFGHASPKLLESRLANDPDFFCMLIQAIYRSRNDDVKVVEPTEESKRIATNAYNLLHSWKRVPGIQDDGSFDGEWFSNWLLQVIKTTTESGHNDVAFIQLGEVLINSPADPSGLWIHHSVATALNDRLNDSLRDGYKTGCFNSRGAHVVDITGEAERVIALKYRNKAETVENEGFQRFAVSLRELAERYEREAERNIADFDMEVTES